MKKFMISCCAAMLTSIMLVSGCNYSKQKEKILNIAAEEYRFAYQSGDRFTEAVVASESMRVYYFTANGEGYEMSSESLVSEFLYKDVENTELNDSIHYSFSDNGITVNKVKVDVQHLDYQEFKTYCLDYFGDTADKDIAERIYSLIQSFLTESKIYKVMSGILDNLRLCYAETKLSNLCESTIYLNIIKQRLSVEEYKIFLNKISELSATNRKSVTIELLTDADYTAVYPTVRIWRNGNVWFNVYMLKYL